MGGWLDLASETWDYACDLAGNVIDDGSRRYLYDAEGRICAVYQYQAPMSMTGYVYDAEGSRIAKGTIATFSCDQTANGFAVTSNYVVGTNGEQLDEYDGVGNTLLHGNTFAGGRLLSSFNGTNWTYAFNDWLGTKRAKISADGNLANLSTFTSLPFGDGRTASDPDDNHLHFTGKYHDDESGNDYFGARYYASAMGRFMSPDWSEKIEPVPYAKLDNPQSLNLYSYVWNSPLSRNDPDGHLGPCDTGNMSQCMSYLEERIGTNLGGDGKAQQQSAGSAIRAAMSPVVENFGSIGGTDANNNHFTYDVQSGGLYQVTPVNGDLPTYTLLGTGYSGKGDGLNNPSMEDVQGAKGKSDAGPIPEGSYTIGKMFNNVGSTGPGSMRLTPSATNEMYGRSSFLMHGDNSRHIFSASEGCIIMPKGVRDTVSSSGVIHLEVTTW